MWRARVPPHGDLIAFLRRACPSTVTLCRSLTSQLEGRARSRFSHFSVALDDLWTAKTSWFPGISGAGEETPIMAADLWAGSASSTVGLLSTADLTDVSLVAGPPRPSSTRQEWYVRLALGSEDRVPRPVSPATRGWSTSPKTANALVWREVLSQGTQGVCISQGPARGPFDWDTGAAHPLAPDGAWGSARKQGKLLRNRQRPQADPGAEGILRDGDRMAEPAPAMAERNPSGPGGGGKTGNSAVDQHGA